MEIDVLDEQQALKIDVSSVKKIAQAALDLEGVSCDEASIVFVNEEEMCRIHGERFNDPTLTDCMSFPVDDDDDDGYRVLGDVVVCPAVAIAYTAENGGNPMEETTLYVLHGLLHLMGYRDSTTEEQKEMRQAEQRHMAHLHALNLVLK